MVQRDFVNGAAAVRHDWLVGQLKPLVDGIERLPVRPDVRTARQHALVSSVWKGGTLAYAGRAEGRVEFTAMLGLQRGLVPRSLLLGVGSGIERGEGWGGVEGFE